MSRYRVPKFIEKEPKVIGPMTFKQFAYIGVAALISLILYFTISLIPFILISLVLFGAAIALAFITLGGKPLPIVLWNSISYLFSSKIYLWKKKKGTPTIVKKKKAPPKQPQQEESQQSPLRMTQKSRLKEMETKIKTGKK